MYNTFIFISPFTFYNRNIDLPILGFFRKKIAVVLLGCAERDPSDSINHGDWGYCKICTDYTKQKGCLCNSLKLKKDRFRLIEKYSDYIFAEKDLVGFVKNNYNIFPCYFAADPPKAQENVLNKINNKKIVIAHLPSNSILKGSKYVIQIMNKVCKEYPEIEFITKRMSNKELLDFLEKEVHIVIDELHSPYHGLLAVEAMARGCIVLTRVLNYFYIERPGLPVISVNPDNLESVISNLLNDKGKMADIAKRSIDYYKKYHTLQSVGDYYKRTLELNE
jgi:glycosyltransferase involved in cell wall biosynthesis